jgi:hypothetical protein
MNPFLQTTTAHPAARSSWQRTKSTTRRRRRCTGRAPRRWCVGRLTRSGDQQLGALLTPPPPPCCAAAALATLTTTTPSSSPAPGNGGGRAAAGGAHHRASQGHQARKVRSHPSHRHAARPPTRMRIEPNRVPYPLLPLAHPPQILTQPPLQPTHPPPKKQQPGCSPSRCCRPSPPSSWPR